MKPQSSAARLPSAPLATLRPRAIFRLAGSVIFCLSVLAGCEANEARREDERKKSDVVAIHRNKTAVWLAATDERDPALWFASFAEKHDLAADDPPTLEVRRLLQEARLRFLESDRMIVNRTAQLSEMLAEDHRPEAPVPLLETLIGVASPDSTAKAEFGDLCQFYLNLRRAGRTREDALAILRERFEKLKRPAR